MSTELEDQIPLTFGKYKGRTPVEVANDDPGYIAWLYVNVPGTVSQDLAVACDQDPGFGGFADPMEDGRDDDYGLGHPNDYGDR